MILCPKCGKANAPLTPRCIECGQTLTPSAPSPPLDTPIPASVPQSAPLPSPPPYAPPGSLFPPAPSAGPAPPAPYYRPNVNPSAPGMRPPAYTAPYLPANTTVYCLVCGAPMPGMSYAYCPVCAAPVGTVTNPNDPTATTFLSLADVRRMNPAAGEAATVFPTGIPAMFLPNPMRAVSEDPGQGWNWGAALMTTPWAFRHRVWWAGIFGSINLLFWIYALGVGISTAGKPSTPDADPTSAFIGGALVLLSSLFWLFKTIYLGTNGNRLAWDAKLYRDTTEMRKAQSMWATWGALVSILTIILFCVILALQS